jgi:hypothetical protein
MNGKRGLEITFDQARVDSRVTHSYGFERVSVSKPKITGINVFVTEAA